MNTITITHNALRNGEFPKAKLEVIDGVSVIITPMKTIPFHQEVVIAFDENIIKEGDDVLSVAFELGRLTQLYLNRNY
jgi:hypothetical protein